MNALFPPPADTSTLKLRVLSLSCKVIVRYLWHEWQRCGTERSLDRTFRMTALEVSSRPCGRI